MYNVEHIYVCTIGKRCTCTYIRMHVQHDMQEMCAMPRTDPRVGLFEDVPQVVPIVAELIKLRLCLHLHFAGLGDLLTYLVSEISPHLPTKVISI